MFMMKRNMQKSAQTGKCFSDIVTPEIIKDISFKLAHTEDVSINFIENDYEDEFFANTYNKGRLGILFYKDTAHYITFSENVIKGRNSSWQSVPTAYNIYALNPYPKKTLNYYFILQNANGLTEYIANVFRLLKTMGINFLNAPSEAFEIEDAFKTASDFIRFRNTSKLRNKTNNSTYITRNSAGYEVFAKTYGASKYESSFFIYALQNIVPATAKIKVYEIIEGGLEELPKSSQDVIGRMNNVELIPTSLQLDIKALHDKDTLRSPRYKSHLFDKLGDQHCAFCNCNIRELIQGAHIWDVASIKRENSLSDEEKVMHATSGDNGLWLCANHHLLFDRHILNINSNGEVVYHHETDKDYLDFMDEITLNKTLDDDILTDEFQYYLWKRNAEMDF